MKEQKQSRRGGTPRETPSDTLYQGEITDDRRIRRRQPRERHRRRHRPAKDQIRDPESSTESKWREEINHHDLEWKPTEYTKWGEIEKTESTNRLCATRVR